MLFTLILLIVEINKNNTAAVDLYIYDFIIKFKNGSLTLLMKFITNFGSERVLRIAVAVFLLICCLKRHYFVYGIMALIDLAMASLLTYSLKYAVQRPRPDVGRLVQAGGFSFPSGHSLCSAAFYGFLIFFCVRFCKKPYKQIFAVLLTVLILSVGLSRIYLGVHYASDVAGGFLTGTIWLFICICLIDLYEHDSRGK